MKIHAFRRFLGIHFFKIWDNTIFPKSKKHVKFTFFFEERREVSNGTWEKILSQVFPKFLPILAKNTVIYDKSRVHEL